MTELAGLPGSDLVTAGLADLGVSRLSPAGLLLGVARGRLRALGVVVPPVEFPQPVEIALYESLIAANVSDPYARYNAMLRELSSFLEALEARQRRRA